MSGTIICPFCKDTFSYTNEYVTLNANGDSVNNEEFEMERNAQNPDYAVVSICYPCYEHPDNQKQIAEEYGVGLTPEDFQWP